MTFDNDCDVTLCSRCDRKLVFIEYMFYNIPNECRKNGAACCNTSQVVKLRIDLLQHLLVLQPWYNVTSNAT